MQPLVSPLRLEPCLLTEADGELLDLLAQIPTAASALGGGLHRRTALNLADLVRVMNCYYSNLIEGHNTRPRDIERALADDLDTDGPRRDLQLEARQHIRVQQQIDQHHAAGTLPDPVTSTFLRELHRDFYRNASPAQLLLEGPIRHLSMVPGEFRCSSGQDNAVGRHQPPSSTVVPQFMAYFEDRYRADRLGPATRLLALPAAHHRLNFIHPFPDGNGRVSRLMSHAMALQAGIGANGLWSISRGLARGLQSRSEYQSMMDHADMPRQGDLDGRGNLSQRALVDFCIWFLKVCLDQMRFMQGQLHLEGLADRLRQYAQRAGWRQEAGGLLVEVLHRGEIARGDAMRITTLGERTSRDLLSQLLADGILGSDSPKGAVSLRFPIRALDALFPLLFAQS